MFKTKYIVVALGTLAFLSAGTVLASPNKIRTTHIAKGHSEASVTLKSVSEYEHKKHEEYEAELEFEYGISDDLQLIVEGVFVHHAGGDTDLHNIAVGGKYKLTDESKYFFGSALHLSYDIGTAPGVSDDIGAELIVEKTIGDLIVRSNIEVTSQVGHNSHDEEELKFRLGTYKTFGHDLTFGFEYYADFGEFGDTGGYEAQKHYFGPRISWGKELSHHRHLGFEFGYFAGISRAAEDATILFRTKYAF